MRRRNGRGKGNREMGFRLYGRSFLFWLGAVVLAAILVNAVLWIVALFVPAQGSIAAGDCIRFQNVPPVVLCGENAPIPFWAQMVLNWPAFNLGAALQAIELQRTGLRQVAWAAGTLFGTALLLRLALAKPPEPSLPVNPDEPSFWTTESYVGNVFIALLMIAGLLMVIGSLHDVLFPRGSGGLFYPSCARRGFLSIVQCRGVPLGFVVEFIFAAPIVVLFALISLAEPELATAAILGPVLLFAAIIAVFLKRRAKAIRLRRESRAAQAPPGDGDPA